MSSVNPDDMLLIGRIVSAFGVRGELKASIISSRPEHLAKVKQIYLGDTFTAYSVKRFHAHKANIYILRLAEVTTRDEAEELRGLELYIPEQQAAPLEADEYFLHDLLGLQVQTSAGAAIGSIIDVLETGANDVLVVRRIGQPDVLVPMIRDVVQAIDLAAKTLTITALEDIIPE